MKLAGLVTDRENKNLSVSDRLLIEPLAQTGFIAEPAVWDDQKTDWTKYDVLIFRSCWNYYHKYQEWLKWLDGLAALGVKAYNPIEVLRWNSHKSYLLDLEKQAVKIVPTSLVKAGEIVQGTNLIVKPAVGANSYQVRKVNKFKASEDFLVQPYLDEVKLGELQLIFINKQYSHGVIKFPKRIELIDIPETIVNQARKILNYISSPLLYARVDGLIQGDQFLLMELELIEPHLFLDLYPPAAEKFAASLI
jgi:hypothetical protein